MTEREFRLEETKKILEDLARDVEAIKKLESIAYDIRNKINDLIEKLSCIDGADEDLKIANNLIERLE